MSRNNNKIDYTKFVVKKQAKTKNLEIKKRYLILQKKNKRLQKLVRDNKIALQKQYCKYINNANKDFSNNIFILKR